MATEATERAEVTLERVRRRADIKAADELIRSNRITGRQIERAHDSEVADKFPEWTYPYLRDVLRTTLDVYAGISVEGSRRHVFVIRGLEYNGVYDAEEAWVRAVGGEFERKAFERWNYSTRATTLGAVCFCLLGGRIYERYVRKGGDGDQLGLLDDSEPEDVVREEPPDLGSVLRREFHGPDAFNVADLAHLKEIAETECVEERGEDLLYRIRRFLRDVGDALGGG